MAGTSQTLSLNGLASWAEAQAKVPDLTPAMKRCALAVRASTAQNFTGGHAPDGTAWPPLKRPRHGKRHKGSKGKPLRDTGLLMASASAFGSGHIEQATPVGLTYGTNLDYASYHQFGTRTIPQRAFIGMNDALADKCALIVADFLEERLKK